MVDSSVIGHPSWGGRAGFYMKNEPCGKRIAPAQQRLIRMKVFPMPINLCPVDNYKGIVASEGGKWQ